MADYSLVIVVLCNVYIKNKHLFFPKRSSSKADYKHCCVNMIYAFSVFPGRKTE